MTKIWTRTTTCSAAATSHALRSAILWGLLATSLVGQNASRFAVGADSNSTDPRSPNIVVLLADDLGYAELGCQGNTDVPTPHIDALAHEGVRCTSGYVTAPFCAASRAGLLTGRYQTRCGFEFNPIGVQNADPAIGLPVDTVTLPEHLHAAGYATGLVGKWHLGGTAAHHPLRTGFDEFYGFLHEGHHYVPPPYRDVTTWLRRKTLPGGGSGRWTSSDGKTILSTHMGHDEPPYDADNPIQRGSQPVAEAEYFTDAVTREAVDFIRRHADRPFFLYVAYNAVHSPLQARQEDLDQFQQIDDPQRRIFAAMLSRLDHSVGEILRSLRDTEQEQQTLVWFLSDNGGPTKELTSSNAPFRGGKGQLYEGGVRVPFLIRWPGRIPAGRTIDSPISSLDIFATCLTLANHPTIPTDGRNLLPLLGGDAPKQQARELYWRVGEKGALRYGDWKIVRHSSASEGQGWELYNLSVDPGETQDLAGREETQLRDLQSRWERLNGEMQPPRWR